MSLLQRFRLQPLIICLIVCPERCSALPKKEVHSFLAAVIEQMVVLAWWGWLLDN